jgi:hypothetical protein
MLEKLLVRVRSWFHIDPSTAAVTPSGSAPAALAGPGLLGNGNGSTGFARGAAAPKEARRSSTPPPPMPGEAFGDSSEMSLAMEAQPESGMVITESGIIIIDPNVDPDAARLATTPISSGAQAVVRNDSSNANTWALPNLARPTSAEASKSSDASDWDAVLTRARAQLAPPPAPGPTKRK